MYKKSERCVSTCVIKRKASNFSPPLKSSEFTVLSIASIYIFSIIDSQLFQFLFLFLGILEIFL